MYVSLTSFHFYIFLYNFLRSTLFKPCDSLSLHHPFLCLGSPCHRTASAQPTHSNNPLPIVQYVLTARVQNVMTYLAYDHINDSFFICCYSFIHSFSSLSYDRSKASSKMSSPHSAIQSFLFQMRVSSPFLKVIQ